jgi:hypothetical protein
MHKVNGIYYATEREIDQIGNLNEEEKKKWDKKTVRNIDKYFYRPPGHPIMAVEAGRRNRNQRRTSEQRAGRLDWRDGNAKDNLEHKTKHIETRKEKRTKRQQCKVSRRK